MHEELVDRFGPLPEPAQALIESHRLRILGHPLGISRIDATAEHIQIQFAAHPAIDPAGVIDLVQKNRGWKLAGPTRLRIAANTATLKERAQAVRKAIELLEKTRIVH
jgi:transcription-repair coupling factor (superfamily II helicase)